MTRAFALPPAAAAPVEPLTTVADYLFSRLTQLGVTEVFGVPGDFSLVLLDQLENFDGLRWIGTASELGAAYAADGYARARGLAVLCTTFGVGELSAANGVASSMAEDVGILHVVGAPPTTAIEAGAALHHSFADGDLGRFIRIAAEITDKQVVLGRGSIERDLDRALKHWSQTRRPTYLLVPQDLALQQVNASRLTIPLSPNAPNAHDLSAATQLASEFLSQFPDAVAVVGHLVARWSSWPAVATLTAKAALCCTLPNSKSVIDEGTPGYVGMFSGKLSSPRMRAQIEGDAGRVLIGCTLADTTTGGLSHSFPPQSTMVVGRDFIRSPQGEVNGVQFPILINALSKIWPSRPQVLSDDSPALEPAAFDKPGHDPLNQDLLWSTVAAELPPGLRLFADIGTSHFGVLDVALPPNTRFEPAVVWSAIGYSLPAALGSALADRSRRCVAVVGDGAAQMAFQELGLISRERLNPVIILVSNGGYTVERLIRGENAAYNDIVEWNWASLPAALGVGPDVMIVHRARTQAGFRAALKEALRAQDVAHLIEVATPPLDGPPTLVRMSQMLRAKAKTPSLDVNQPVREDNEC